MSDPRVVEKLMIIRDEGGAIKDFLLPTGLTIEQVKAWTQRFMDVALERNKLQQRNLMRFEGRTFVEDWAKPDKYFSISSNTRLGEGGFDVGLRILTIIEKEGRHSIDEICREIGAVDREPLTLIVNNMRKDHYLKDYTESDGTQSLEMLTREERNKALALPPPEPPKTIVMPCLAYLNAKEDTTYHETGVTM